MIHVTGKRVDDSGIDNCPLILCPAYAEIPDPDYYLAATEEHPMLIHAGQDDFHPAAWTLEEFHALNFQWRKLKLAFQPSVFNGYNIVFWKHQDRFTVFGSDDDFVTPASEVDVDLYPGLHLVEFPDVYPPFGPGRYFRLNIGFLGTAAPKFVSFRQEQIENHALGFWPIYNYDYIDFTYIQNTPPFFYQGIAAAHYGSGLVYPFLYFSTTFTDSNTGIGYNVQTIRTTPQVGFEVVETPSRFQCSVGGPNHGIPLYLTRLIGDTFYLTGGNITLDGALRWSYGGLFSETP